jgi:hypothetical protein
MAKGESARGAVVSGCFEEAVGRFAAFVVCCPLYVVKSGYTHPRQGNLSLKLSGNETLQDLSLEDPGGNSPPAPPSEGRDRLIELFFEFVEFSFQLRQVISQDLDVLFHSCNTLRFRKDVMPGISHRFFFNELRFTAKKVNVTGFLAAGLSREAPDKADFFEADQCFINLIQGLERAEPGGAPLDLARCLRSAKQQNAKDRGFSGNKVVRVGKALLGLRDPADVTFMDQFFLDQFVHNLFHGLLRVGDDRIATGFLIAGGRHGIDGKRVIFRCRKLFLDQTAEHPDLFVAEHDVHGFDFHC